MSWMFRLDPAILRLEGDDTRRFLNSMLTNNFKDMNVGGGNHNAITDRKGRLEGLLDGYMTQENQALLVLDGMDLAWTIDRLDMYIIMDPIEISVVSDTHGVLSLQGEGAAALVSEVGLPLPEDHAVAHDQGWVLRSDRVADSGFDLVFPLNEVEPLSQRLAQAGARHGSDGDYDALRVERGLPRWPDDMGRRAFPHELGLRERVLHFQKGCYMGQEVINRMETMGKLTRRLVRVRMDADAVPGSITVDGESVGDLTSIGAMGGRIWGLGLLRSAAWVPGVRIDRGGVGGTVDPCGSTLRSSL